MVRRTSLFLLFFFALTIQAQPALSDTSAVHSSSVFNLLLFHEKTIDISEYLEVFEDSSRILTIEDVSSPNFSARFHVNKFDRKPWQDQSFVIWARVVIKNNSGHDQHIYFSEGFGDTIICFRQTGAQSFDIQATGKLFPRIETRGTLIPHADFKYELTTGETATFFLRLTQDDYEWIPEKIPLSLYTYSAIIQFQNSLRKSWILHGLYFGMAILMLVYSIALWIIFRERAYLWLALFQLSNILYFLHHTGIGFYLLYPGCAFLNKYGSPMVLWGIVFWQFMFICSYLKVRNNFPGIYYVLLAVTLIASFIRLAFWTVGYYQLGRYIEDFAIITLIILMFAVVAYMAFWQKIRLAKLMLLGEFSIVIAGLISGLTYTQFINFTSNYIINILQAGFTLQMLLWTVAIIDKISTLRKEKNKSQARELEMAYENKQLIHDQNILLEKKVEERTQKLKEAQSQLVQSEKMASLGMLSAGIAHEINNPVNFINAGVVSLQKDYEDLQQIIQSIGQLPPRTQQLANELGLGELLSNIPQTIKDIKTGVQRTKEIVNGLRNFTRMDDTEIMEADIHEKINSTLSLLTHRIKNKIQITKDYDDRIGMIKCYPGPLNQVFMNLLNNAIDAIDEKANQNSAHGVQPRQPYQIKISTNLHETTLTKHVKIVISDNGTGLPEEIRDKLFDPFFTTKEVGKGTGLGLSICHGIIEKHKGSISFDSRVGEGTDFIIILPLE